VVTNIDADHLETYEGDFQRLRDTFEEFLRHLPFYGLAILCLDDPEVRALRPRLTRPVRTYGFSDDADVRARRLTQSGARTRFEVTTPDTAFRAELNLPGDYNVLNALAAITVALELGVPEAAITRALSGFQGIGRRFQVYGDIALGQGSVTLVDDYGHHPSEITAVLQAVRNGWPERRLVVAFQPHRYSRTRELFDDFARVLAEVDALVVTEVYAAGEPALPGADGRSLCRAIRARGQVDPVFVESVDELAGALPSICGDGDLLVTLGAGSIGNLAAKLAAAPASGADA